MQNHSRYDMQTATSAAEDDLVSESELGILMDVFRMLPSGVTVQDEQGRFLLMNDAAAAQLGRALGADQHDFRPGRVFDVRISHRPR